MRIRFLAPSPRRRRALVRAARRGTPATLARASTVRGEPRPSPDLGRVRPPAGRPCYRSPARRLRSAAACAHLAPGFDPPCRHLTFDLGHASADGTYCYYVAGRRLGDSEPRRCTSTSRPHRRRRSMLTSPADPCHGEQRLGERRTRPMTRAASDNASRRLAPPTATAVGWHLDRRLDRRALLHRQLDHDNDVPDGDVLRACDSSPTRPATRSTSVRASRVARGQRTRPRCR